MSDPTQQDPPASFAPAPVVVKKYANRRLYNTESSAYITLENLAAMVREGRDFVVYDARSGDDITRSVLTQIIVEEESKGRATLPTNFLRQLIGFYGGGLPGFVPSYLEQTMSTLARQQEQVREAMAATMGNLLPPGLEDMRKQNLAMMERAMGMFAPFYRPGVDRKPAPEGDLASPPDPTPAVTAEQVHALEAEIERLRIELAARQHDAPKLKGPRAIRRLEQEP